MITYQQLSRGFPVSDEGRRSYVTLQLFEKGIGLSDTCRKQLQEAETRVEILLKKNDKLQPEPFPPEKE